MIGLQTVVVGGGPWRLVVVSVGGWVGWSLVGCGWLGGGWAAVVFGVFSVDAFTLLTKSQLPPISGGAVGNCCAGWLAR